MSPIAVVHQSSLAFPSDWLTIQKRRNHKIYCSPILKFVSRYPFNALTVQEQTKRAVHAFVDCCPSRHLSLHPILIPTTVWHLLDWTQVTEREGLLNNNTPGVIWYSVRSANNDLTWKLFSGKEFHHHHCWNVMKNVPQCTSTVRLCSRVCGFYSIAIDMILRHSPLLPPPHTVMVMVPEIMTPRRWNIELYWNWRIYDYRSNNIDGKPEILLPAHDMCTSRTTAAFLHRVVIIISRRGVVWRRREQWNHVFGANQTNFSFLLVFYPFTSFACNFIMAHVGRYGLVVLFVLQLR